MLLTGAAVTTAGAFAVKGALNMTALSMVSYSAYKIVKLRNSPPEIVELMRGRVYDNDMKGNPVTYFEERKDGSAYYRFKIPEGKSLEDFKSCVPAVEDQLNAEVKVWADGGLVHMECLMKPLPAFVAFQQYMFEEVRKVECGVLIGEGRRGLRVIDLSASSTPHILVGGVTGGGKSNFLNVLICGSACAYTPEEVQFYLVDLKDGVEFAPYETLPHVRSIESLKTGTTKRIIDDIDDCSLMLGNLARTIQGRNRLFKEFGVRNISEYRRLGRELPHIIVVADEIGDFAAIQETKVRNALFAQWATLTRKGRSAGIHVVLCTQIPDADSVPRQLKGNIPVKLGFRMTKRENSETIFDSDAAIHIPPIPGRAILKIGDYESIQVPFLDLRVIEEEIVPQLEGYGEIIETEQEEVETISA